MMMTVSAAVQAILLEFKDKSTIILDTDSDHKNVRVWIHMPALSDEARKAATDAILEMIRTDGSIPPLHPCEALESLVGVIFLEAGTAPFATYRKKHPSVDDFRASVQSVFRQPIVN
jgi:hypothetical protein